MRSLALTSALLLAGCASAPAQVATAPTPPPPATGPATPAESAKPPTPLQYLYGSPEAAVAVRAAVGAVVGAISALAREDQRTMVPESMRDVADLFEAGLPISATAEAGRWGEARRARGGTASGPPSTDGE